MRGLGVRRGYCSEGSECERMLNLFIHFVLTNLNFCILIERANMICQYTYDISLIFMYNKNSLTL